MAINIAMCLWIWPSRWRLLCNKFKYLRKKRFCPSPWPASATKVTSKTMQTNIPVHIYKIEAGLLAGSIIISSSGRGDGLVPRPFNLTAKRLESELECKVTHFLYFWIQISQKGDPNVTKRFPAIKRIAKMFEMGMRASAHTKNNKNPNKRCPSLDLRYKKRPVSPPARQTPLLSRLQNQP